MSSGTRVICYLFGCACNNDPGCDRCGTDLYDFEFIQVGRLDPVFRAYWAVFRFVQRFTGRKCDQCGRWYWHGYNEWLCSEGCFDKWLPF